MSTTGAGPSSPSGVVRNSALAFVDSQQSQAASAQDECMQDTSREQMGQADRMPMPAGLKALCEVYSRLYPDQPNPLQVTTRLKYWLGGHDPLDYISMYWNPGKPEENIPPHWHYVSFGISDLHGDGRVHLPPSRAGPSGLGMELTFRLHVEDAAAPPLWPAALLQALARYMFTTGNKFCAGDHISWHAPLDARATSRVRHLLVCADPQLGETRTPHGAVAFLQIVGCTGRELRAAQRGSGFDVLKLISEDPRCGAGSWLVTRVNRRVSARGVRVSRHAPAQLAGVSARLQWGAWAPDDAETTEAEASPPELPACVEQQIKDTLQRGLSTMSSDRTGPEGHMSTDSFEMSSIERALPHVPELMQSSLREDSVEYFDGVHIVMNAEGASLLPLAIDGRVTHGRHFTWREGSRAVTLVPPNVAGAVAVPARPLAARGAWLQVLIPKELAQDMSAKVSKLSHLAETDSESDSDEETSKRDNEPIVLPLTLTWPKYRIKITVVKDHEML
ncbi:hypothetical protein ABMA28_012797 [Loxostege sticticalis]|uniref:Suppressor of fused homolog n=1 Tax=Loxostege sticticalis TaxID=481309 RepID=A0ABD0S2K7_LOXSC